LIKIVGPKDKRVVGAINTTTSSRTWSKELSPMLLGPVEVKTGPRTLVSKKMENAWQFTKVYPQFTDIYGNPCDLYWKWAIKGFEDDWSHRYPMGKGAKPLYSLWDNERLDYIEARKKIYMPLYKESVYKTEAFEKLKSIYLEKKEITLWDFDGYDNTGLSWDDIINNPKKKMGHAFVLGMMLDEST
jgi:hypothetical protein